MSNKSGVYPVEFRVLIEPEKLEESDTLLKSAMAAGIELPREYSEREQMAVQKGLLIDVGGNAFVDWRGRKPEVGHRVMFSRYAGQNITGEDGKFYRLLNDKDISAILGESE